MYHRWSNVSLESPMTDTLPDRLSINPMSPHYDGPLLERGIGIKFKGAEKTNVEEYSVSEGWIKVAAGKSRDRYGNPMTIKLKGTVEPYYERAAEGSESPDEGENVAGKGDDEQA